MSEHSPSPHGPHDSQETPSNAPIAGGFVRRRLLQTLGYSWRGLRFAWRHEEAFRVEVLLSLVLIPLALYAGQTPVERVLLIGSWGAVLVVELLNTGIEKAIDRISKDLHPLSGAAKDLGSAAVFMSLLLAATTWALVLL